MRTTGSVPATVIADTDKGYVFCMPADLADEAAKDRFARLLAHSSWWWRHGSSMPMSPAWRSRLPTSGRREFSSTFTCPSTRNRGGMSLIHPSQTGVGIVRGLATGRSREQTARGGGWISGSGAPHLRQAIHVLHVKLRNAARKGATAVKNHEQLPCHQGKCIRLPDQLQKECDRVAAVVTVDGPRLTAQMYAGFSRQVWRTVDLAGLLGRTV